MSKVLVVDDEARYRDHISRALSRDGHDVCTAASGQDAKVWLSAVYLKRAADACKGELTIKISDPKKPVLVEAGNFTAVIMPMLVEGQKDPFPEDEGIAISLPELAMA